MINLQSIDFHLLQRCTIFLGQGPQCISFGAHLHSKAYLRQNYDLNFRKLSIKNRKQNLFNLPFCYLWFDIVAIRGVSDCNKLQNC